MATWVGRLRVAGLLLAVSCAGCGAYLRNRWNDSKDMWDFGFTITAKPCLAFLPADYMNVTPIGFSSLEGRYYGMYAGQWGSRPLSDHSWGAIVWGDQTLQLGEFNVDDPRQFHPAEIAALRAANKPLPSAPRRYNIGLVRVPLQGGQPPYPDWFS